MKIASGNAGRVAVTSTLKPVDVAEDMRRYDQLPREVRDAFKELSSDFACVGIARVLKQGVPPPVLASRLRDQARDLHRNMLLEVFGAEP